MAATLAATAQRSWAQIVKPGVEESQKSEKILQPASRGSLLRFCRGEVLKMVTNYGWLMVYGNIDHPSVEKHGGDVYIHKDDVVDGELAPGDIVTFYLYVDEKGLGAEFCQVEEKASARQGFNPEATPFMPSIPKPAPQSQSFKLNAAAKDFMPAVTCNDMLWRLSQVFDSDDEDESEDESEFDVTKPWKAPSSEGSTRGGETSDSEEESSCGGCSDSETEPCPVKESLTYVFRPPPGLKLPKVHTPVFCLPPGLCPPGL